MKNEIIFPIKAIEYCLKEANIKSSELDYVALASFISPFDDTITRKNKWTVSDYLKEQNKIWKPFLIENKHKKKKSVIDIFPEKIDFNMYPKQYWKNNYKTKILIKNT